MITQGEALFVDGYDETTKTVYEFMVAFIMGVLNVSQTIATGNTIVIQIVPSQKSMKPPVKRHRSYVKQAIR